MEWGYIIALVFLGAFIGIVINASTKAKGKILQEDFINLGTLAGRPLSEITAEVGSPVDITACLTSEGLPGSLYTWSKYPYSITLVFDESLICIGVNKEMSI